MDAPSDISCRQYNALAFSLINEILKEYFGRLFLRIPELWIYLRASGPFKTTLSEKT
jgi:hypothetical protein